MMIISGMSIRQIRHACILAEEGNFISAARRLNLTQPALSRSIQSLEASLGLRLFDRLPGGVRPTVEGRRILEHGKELLRLEAGLRKEAALLARGEAGRIAFGIGPMLVPLLGPVLSDVLAGDPAIDVRVDIEPVHVLGERLLDDRIDFFIADTSQAGDAGKFVIEPLRSIHAGYYVRAGHPLAGRAGLAPDDLAPFSMASPALGEHRALVPETAAAIACEDSAVLKQVVMATNSVLLGMELAMQPELAEGRMVKLALELSAGGYSKVGVVERRGCTRGAVAARLVAAFSAALGVEGTPSDAGRSHIG